MFAPTFASDRTMKSPEARVPEPLIAEAA